MRFISLFSGIDGLGLGLERAGMTCVAQVEIDPFCRRILEKHWPNVPKWGDITKVKGADLPDADLIAGGFPCTDVSQAGKRTGLTHEDGTPTRSGLWFEFARLIGEIRPRYVIAENVPGLLVYDGMRRVLGQLSGLGYDCVWRCLRASEFGASHLRKRVFLIATLADAECDRGGQQSITGQADPATDRLADGGSQLAHGAQRGRGIVRQPSGSTGFVNGRGEAVADAGCGQSDIPRREGGIQRTYVARDGDQLADSQHQRFGISGETHHDNGHHASGYDTDGCDSVVADTAPELHNGAGNGRTGRRGELTDYGEPLDNAASPRWDGRPENSGAARTGENGEQGGMLQPEYGCSTLADADCAGLEERNGRGSHAVQASSLPAGFPAFAPGPSDERWPAVLRERPDLAPALAYAGHAKRKTGGSGEDAGSGETDSGHIAGDGSRGEPAPPDEPGAEAAQPQIRGMADGLSSISYGDPMKDRTKRLSRLGNAVVPACAEWLGRRLLEYDRAREND